MSPGGGATPQVRLGLRALEEADCLPCTRVGVFRYDSAAGPPEAGHWLDNPMFEIKGFASSGWEEEVLYVAVSEGGELSREDWDRVTREEKIQVRDLIRGGDPGSQRAQAHAGALFRSKPLLEKPARNPASKSSGTPAFARYKAP